MSLSDKELLQINQALFSFAHSYELRMIKENFTKKTGLTLYDCSILMAIGQDFPVRSTELAQKMNVAASTISVSLRRLTAKKIVDMKRDSNDRRSWWLHLTEQGQSAYCEVVSETVRYTKDFIASLHLKDQQKLHKLLLQVSHTLGYTWQ